MLQLRSRSSDSLLMMIIENNLHLVDWRKVSSTGSIVNAIALSAMVVVFHFFRLRQSRDFQKKYWYAFGQYKVSIRSRLYFIPYHKGLPFSEYTRRKFLVRPIEIYLLFVYGHVVPGLMSSMLP